MKLHVVIDTLVLDGADWIRPGRLRAELERELSRAFSAPGVAVAGSRTHRSDHLVTKAPMTERAIGGAVGETIAGVIR